MCDQGNSALTSPAVGFWGPSGDPRGATMAGKIFINYRREDSIAVAGRLQDRLAAMFGRDNLFMDVDNIPIGINFEEYLNNQVAQCDAMLSVIGPNWLDAKDDTNQRRLDKPDDFVAIEIAAALARNILVIPDAHAQSKRTASFFEAVRLSQCHSTTQYEFRKRRRGADRKDARSSRS